MSIKYLPITVEDAVSMAEMGFKAFKKDVFNIATFNLDTATAEQVRELHSYRADLIKGRLSAANTNDRYWFKAIDDSTGSLVGYTGMYAPGTAIPASRPLSKPSCLNEAIYDELDAKLKTTRHGLIGDRKDVWYVQSMAVHPEYRGRGIAKRLLELGLVEIDNQGQDVYLEATAAGQPLYRRMGFEDLEEISMSSIDYRLMAMIRHPRTSQLNGTH